MRKIVIYLALLGAMLGILTGCSDMGREQKIKDAKYLLYYIDEDETQLVAKVYEPSSEKPQDMLTELMQFLKEDTVSDGNLPLLPVDVEVTTYKINEKTLTLDFNAAYLEMNDSREVLARAGVVKMLAQIPDIDYIKFSVEGKELTDSKGVPLSIMNGDTFVEYSGSDINSYQTATITLYFTNQDGTRLLPEERTVYYNSNVSLERVVVEQMLKGPDEDGHYATLPSTVNILGVTTEGGDCYVNLDSRFTSDALALPENIIIYSLVNSLIEACQIKDVQISVDGESNLTFRENMKLNQFFTANKDLVVSEEE